MQRQNQKKLKVLFSDQLELQNVNLITGVPINHQRIIYTDVQINDLCVDEKLPKHQKFIVILHNENKMQKWSIFENLNLYIDSLQASDKIIQAIFKQYSNCEPELLSILGQGLGKFLEKCKFQLSQKTKDFIYKILYRIMTTTDAQIVQQWILAFKFFFKSTKIDIEQIFSYIKGSFAMNTPPKRRQIAFFIIKSLIQVFVRLNKVASSYITELDQNKMKTRITICEITSFLVKQFPKDEELWKIMFQYLDDKDLEVSKRALKTLTQIKVHENFQIIFQLFNDDTKTIFILEQLGQFIQTFKEQFDSKQKRTKLMSFINRIVRFQHENQLILLIKYFRQVIEVLSQGFVNEQILIESLSLAIVKKRIIFILIDLERMLTNAQFKQKIKSIILKGIKYHNYLIFQQNSQICQLLDLKIEEDITIYINMINKMLENFKWYSLNQSLLFVQQIKMNQTVYQKISLLLLKLILNCPYFLLQNTIKAIVHMIRINRRSIDFLITIRQKLMNSKCWTNRRNYLLIYQKIKLSISFEFQKIIPIFIYKNLQNQKILGLKLQFLRIAADMFLIIEPGTDEKNFIKETVLKFCQDKNRQVSKCAHKVKEALLLISNNHEYQIQAYQRNKLLYQRELILNQVDNESKKLIKTQKDIHRSIVKKKTDTRTTLNLTKQYRARQKNISPSEKSLATIQLKRDTIFRCNSTKVKIPLNKKKK